MSQLVYRAEDGSLKVGLDRSQPQLAVSVYRTTEDKRIISRDGVFVEVSNDGERVLFAVNK